MAIQNHLQAQAVIVEYVTRVDALLDEGEGKTPNETEVSFLHNVEQQLEKQLLSLSLKLERSSTQPEIVAFVTPLRNRVKQTQERLHRYIATHTLLN